jgi:hypothetical protein
MYASFRVLFPSQGISPIKLDDPNFRDFQWLDVYHIDGVIDPFHGYLEELRRQKGNPHDQSLVSDHAKLTGLRVRRRFERECENSIEIVTDIRNVCDVGHEIA